MDGTYQALAGQSWRYYGWVLALLVVVAGAAAAGAYMEHSGHHVTGMTNQVVWGAPHVFAIFLILAASGALNVASMGSVFGRELHKPFGRLSGLSAIALLVGGLSVLVVDLGRPERLVVAMTHYNFKSIFAWNIFLYIGLMVVVVGYLWVLMERRLARHARSVGVVALAWRLVLTTGTGSIFGFLVAREAYDSALIAPLFIAVSLSVGLAVFILVTTFAFRWSGRSLDDSLVRAWGGLQGLFVLTVAYFVIVHHLTNLYLAEHTAVERFILLDGGIYTAVFWLGQVLVGTVLPVMLVYWPREARRDRRVLAAASAVILGTLAQLYVIIIGGQAFPLDSFPGFEVVESSFFDGVVARYAPSVPEVALGIGGVALALLIITIGLRVLRLLPGAPVSAGGPGSGA